GLMAQGCPKCPDHYIRHVRSTVRMRLHAGASFRGALLLRWQLVAFVSKAHRMRIAAMASPTRHFLLAHGVHAGPREIRVDLSHQQNHFPGDILARIHVRLLWFAAAVAIAAIYSQSITKLTHDCVRSVDLRSRREHL